MRSGAWQCTTRLVEISPLEPKTRRSGHIRHSNCRQIGNTMSPRAALPSRGTCIYHRGGVDPSVIGSRDAAEVRGIPYTIVRSIP